MSRTPRKSFSMMPAMRSLGSAAALGLLLAATGPAAATETVPAVTAEQIRALVDEHKGDVVVVNFWASWCPPCLREFPAIIDVYEEYRDRGLEMFAVSMNAPEEMEDIQEFLETYDPPFPIYLAAEQDETFYEDVLEQWFGEMPMTLVFNPAGERVLAHRKELTYEELASEVEALLPSP